MFEDLFSVIVYRLLFSVVFLVIAAFNSLREEVRLRAHKQLPSHD